MGGELELEMGGLDGRGELELEMGRLDGRG